MPFKSEKQRRWMWANEPEMARRWSDEEGEARNSHVNKKKDNSRGSKKKHKK